MSVKLFEHFAALQGEGLFTGTPSVFVRTHGCDMRCAWCDTPHTSHHAARTPHLRLDTQALYDLIRGPDYGHLRHVVYTGGEPTLQWRALGTVMRQLSVEGYCQTVETNGYKFFDELGEMFSFATLLSLSPKLFITDWRETYAILARFAPLVPHTQLKVVVESPHDVEDALSRFAPVVEMDLAVEFILQPEWSKGVKWAKQLAEEVCRHPAGRNVRVMFQTHKFVQIR